MSDSGSRVGRRERLRGYLWAEVGALTGAVAVAAIAAGIFVVFVAGTLFEEEGPLEVWSVLSTLALIVGASLGCRWMLTKHRHSGATRTAQVLFVLLLGLFLVIWYSSTTSIQSNWFPPGLVMALLGPLAARAIATHI